MSRRRLTNRQWERIEPLLPGKASDPGRTGYDNRKALEDILWVVRTGAPWRDLPAEFGKWNTVYQRFRRWSSSGVFDRIFETTQGEIDTRSIQVDGSYIKTHQHAVGARHVHPTQGKGPTRPTHGTLSASERVEAG